MKHRIVNIFMFMFILLFSATSLMAKKSTVFLLIDNAKKEVGEMKPSVLKSMIDNEEAVIVLDIREVEQKAEGEIYADEAYAITRGNLEFYISMHVQDKNALIVTYCRGSSRGVLAAQTLRNLGYKNATTLKGGLRAWAKAGYPVETGLGTVIITEQKE